MSDLLDEIEARAAVPLYEEQTQRDDDLRVLVALVRDIEALADNQQSWIDAGGSGQIITRDAVRDSIRAVLNRHLLGGER